MKNSKQVNLKPCPFCGNVKPICKLSSPSSDIHHIVCLKCGAGQDTIKKWNTRSNKIMICGNAKKCLIRKCDHKIPHKPNNECLDNIMCPATYKNGINTIYNCKFI
jgi:hypothetical protein